MSLVKYNKKRNFLKTPEPKGKPISKGKGKPLRFIIQKHDASHLHYDLRLEMEGVMKSWAVPKGPSLDPSVKRLAMQVEDHPISYNTFEGHIPEGSYGGGDVIVWDNGTYHSLGTNDPKESEEVLLAELKKGTMKFVLEGKKLKGAYALFRFRSSKSNMRGNEWLLVKEKDKYVKEISEKDVTDNPKSVLSQKKLIGRTEPAEKYVRKTAQTMRRKK